MRDQPVSQQNQTFGDVLRSLMDTHRGDLSHWTSITLANGLHVDNSLVRHWLIGDRLPSRHSDTSEKIAKLLGLSPEETVCLRAAYDYSRRIHEEKKTQPRQNARDGVEVLFRPPTTHTMQSIPEEWATQPLPEHITSVQGGDAIARFAIAMYSKAARSRPLGRTIYLTYNGARNFVPQGSEANKWFGLALRRALERGWDVCQLVRLDHNIQRSIGEVESIRAYLGARGAYQPYYHAKQYGTLDVPDGVTIVPGVGALLLFATQHADYVDAGIYFPEKVARTQVNLLIEHVELFHQTPGVLKPLLHVYDIGDDDLEFNEAIRMHEQRTTGAMFLVKGGFGLVSRPESGLADDSTWLAGYTPELRVRWQKHVRGRIDALLRHLEKESYRAICPMNSIVDFVDNGAHARDDAGRHRDSHPPIFKPGERWQQLERVVWLLKTFPNYELGLLEDTHYAENVVTTFWEAIGQQAVMIEAWQIQESQKEKQVNVEITEPTLVRAFQAYGDNLWLQIAPHQRERTWVIWWLEQQMAKLKGRYLDEIAELERDIAETGAE